MKNLKAVARSASQKPYSPFPVQDHKDERFRRPAVPFAGARRRTGWSRLRWRRKARDWQNLDWFGVGYSSPRSGSDPNRLTVTRPSKPFSRTAKIKLGSARFPQPAARHDETGGRAVRCVRASGGGGGGGGVRTREPLVLTSLPSGTTLHLIRWCLSPPTSNVGLNFSTTLHLQNSAMHMGQFEIFRNFLLGCPKWAQILTILHDISNSHLEILSNLVSCLYTSVSAETVKLNFCLEHQSTSIQLEQWTTP